MTNKAKEFIEKHAHLLDNSTKEPDWNTFFDEARIENLIFEVVEMLDAAGVAWTWEKYKIIDGVWFTADMKNIVKYNPKKTDSRYEIPVSVQGVYSTAFKDCMYLKEIVMSEKLLNTGTKPFRWSNCPNLKTIHLY